MSNISGRMTTPIISFCAGALLFTASHAGAAEHGLDEKMSEDSLCAETPEAFNNGKDTKADKDPDLDDPKVLERILGEAVEDIVFGFSGWRRIDHANGKLSSLSQFRDGRLDGLQAGWHENGQKRIRVRMKDGKPDGLLTAWDENGSKIHEVRYKGSYRSFDATIFRWHKNGQKAYQAHYAKDRLVETTWYENGQQSSEKNYKNFFPDGTWVEWDQTGKIVSEVQWKDGRRWDGRWTFMSGDGEYEKRCEIILKDGSGTRIYYRKNGTVFHRATFEGGKRLESIFPPSKTPLDAKDFGGDVAKVLETMSEEDKKKIALWPQEIRAGLLEEIKNSLERNPKNFNAAGGQGRVGSIHRRWRDSMISRLQWHEELHRRELRDESRRKEGEFPPLQYAFSGFIYGEIYEGRSLRVARKAEEEWQKRQEDAQKRHLEEMTAKAKDLRERMMDGRHEIRRAKESGDTKLSLFGSGRDVTDLTPLAELTELTELGISETKATDISPLAKLTKLTTLTIRNNTLNDITPLASLTNLRELELYGNRELTDITPLAGLNKLTKLGIYGNPIADLSPLKGLSNLEHLHLQSIKITELTPLAKLTNLTTLEIQNSRETLTDLTQLRGLTNLEHLLLASNQITDLAPLTALRELTNLSLADNKISDVTPLTKLTNLTELDLRNNPIPLDQQAILRKALPNCRILLGPR